MDIREFLQRHDHTGTKSTILKTLTWLISALIVGTTALVKCNAPTWILVFFIIALGIVIVIFLFAFLFCLFKDRDALRSEKYSIQKMAIEKGVFGDNLAGVIDITEVKGKGLPPSNKESGNLEGRDA